MTARELRHEIVHGDLDRRQARLDRVQAMVCAVCGFGLACVHSAQQREILRLQREPVFHPRQQHIDLPQQERLCEIVIEPRSESARRGQTRVPAA